MVPGLSQQPRSLLTVGEFIENRFKPDVEWALKHAGQKHYDHVPSNHVVPAPGGMRLRGVANTHVQEIVKTRSVAGYSVQTQCDHVKLKATYVGENPAHGVRLPEMQRKETHALSFEQGKEIQLRLPSPVRGMALVSMTASLNVAELLGLRWKRLNLIDQPAFVVETSSLPLLWRPEKLLSRQVWLSESQIPAAKRALGLSNRGALKKIRSSAKFVT